MCKQQLGRQNERAGGVALE